MRSDVYFMIDNQVEVNVHYIDPIDMEVQTLKITGTKEWVEEELRKTIAVIPEGPWKEALKGPLAKLLFTPISWGD